MTEMTEKERKRRFVEQRLGPMLADATRGYVTGCSYCADERGSDEAVLVTVDGDRVFEVNVTADSEWAIVKDVMRAVTGRYE